MTMFVDLSLAQRLERTEGMVGASFVDARNALSSISAESREIGGAIAIFDGPDSPLTQTFCLGMHGVPSAADLAAIEGFFTERGADTMHEVSPFAGVETIGLLVSRGYQPMELGNVLVQEITDVPRPALDVRRIDWVSDGDAWVEASIAGWSSDPAAASLIRSIAEVNLRNERMSHFLVRLDGAPIATGSLGFQDDIALLAGASTVPSARGRGAQAALLAARLADARARGCTIAMMVTEVGSLSQRNGQRNGFRVAYTRTKWRRRLDVARM
jgi:GNAT superfamily N-acetyltransferase